MSPKIVDKKAKKKIIMKHAIKIFAEKGYFQTKIIDIAKEAGIGKGTIYEYFRSKEEIISEAINMLMHSWMEKLPEFYKIKDLKELLKIVLGELDDIDFKNIAIILVEVFIYFARHPEKKDEAEFFMKMAEQHDSMFQSIIENIKKNGAFESDDIDICKLSKIMHVFFDGVFVSILLFPNEKKSYLEIADYFIDIIKRVK
ncbi:TetR/AcrR family transcriptional regulator [bacterium]|nr:TetR/AcrR family transcriptional regulator [bacterium]